MKKSIIGILSATLLGLVSHANAITVDFTYVSTEGGPVLATGSVNATPIGGNEYLAVSGIIDILSDYNLADIGVFPLFAGGPTQFNSPSGAFFSDNIYYDPSSDVVDVAGLLFYNGNTAIEVNLFQNNQTPNPPDYALWAYSPTGGYSTATEGNLLANVTVPDGGMTVAMLGLAMGGMAWVRGKRK